MLRKWMCILLSTTCIWMMTVCTVCAVEAPASLSVTPGYALLEIGETVQLFPTVMPTTADRRLVYQSHDTSVAKVDQNGLVTATGEGETQITVLSEVGRYADSCRVVVSEERHLESVSFSPWNMLTNTSLFATDGYDRNTAISGGNYSYASAYLSRWDGPVFEFEDPYPYGYSASTLSPMDRYFEKDAAFHVQDIAWLFGKKAWNDNEKIKAAVAKYGSVYTTFYAVSDYWCKDRTAFYLPGSFGGILDNLHAVSIIGWDDDFPAERFSVAPPGNGAFICRNSYGESSGEQGHFYISYYDKTLATSINMVLTGVESKENFDKQYLYDPYGTISSWAPFYDNSFYVSNIFPEAGKVLEQDEILRAVSLYTAQENIQYELHIAPVYNDLIDLCFDTPIQSGTLEHAGYHTIRLHRPIALTAGTRYAVVFKLTAPSDYGRICVEYPYTYVDPDTGRESPLSTSARAGYDEGYVSLNQEVWYDVAEIITNCNLCIRAFTDIKEDGVSLLSQIPYHQTEEREYPSDKIMTSAEAEALGLELMPEHARILGIPAENETISLFSAENMTEETGMIFPRKYDMRKENCLPAVRNQGSWGSCWAHASCLSAESFMMRRAKRTDWGVPLSMLTYESMAALSERAERVTALTFANDSVTIGIGETVPLQVDVLPQTADKNLIWSSSSDVVSVDKYGNITGKHRGVAEVLCTDETGTIQASCIVTVLQQSEIAEIILEKEKKMMDVGEVYLPVYHVLPGEAVVDKAHWLSSNEAVCTVNENGKITAIKEGYAEITVQTENGSVDILEVYVKEEGKANIYAMEKTEGGMLIKTGNYRNETVQVYTAFYDKDGKLTGVAVCSVSGGEAGAVPIAEIPEGSVRAKSMMLSSEFRPLCKALEAGVMY